MKNSNTLKLKLGNLALAGFLSLFPTAITIFIFYLYGLNVCHNLNKEYVILNPSNTTNSSLCSETVKDLNSKYVLLIWLFITIPTWGWFYLNHSKRTKK